MFTRIGRLAVRRKRLVLVSSLLGLAVAVILGAGVFAQLSGGGFDDPGSESVRAADILEDEFATGDPNLVLLVTATGGDIDAPAVAEAGLALTEAVAAEETTDGVVSYWSLGSPPPLRSDSGDQALVLGRFPGDPDDWDAAAEEIVERYAGDRGVITVEVGGGAEVFRQVGTTIEGDLAVAESIAVPITLVLLIIVFGGVVAALLPLAVGLVAIPGAFFMLWLITQVTDVSIFSINLVTALGLGLAIDYSLFVVSRFREELAAGRSVEAAVVRTVETAGRTVAFSALTVAVSLSALLIFPLYFLRSFAYGGIGVIAVAMVVSVLTLPALLAILGRRVDGLQLWKRKETPVGEGVWHRIAVTVMKRPLVVALGVVVVLVGLGLPFLRVNWGVPDDRVLPEGNPARQVSEQLRDNFSSAESDSFAVVLSDVPGPDAVEDYAIDVSMVDGVARVDAAGGRYAGGQLVAPADPSLVGMIDGDAAWVNVVPGVEPISAEGEAVVHDIRAIEAPFDVAVGGRSAELVDSKAAIFALVPWAALIIAVSTFVLLFLMFGSVLVPLKAIALNLLSLTATFGAMVWVFQDGNGSGLLGFTATGLTDTTTPILMFCIAFGLSMDYEVFLLSRIKEEHDRTGDNDRSVAIGLEKTGRIVTAAAMLLSVTFLAFATSQVTFIKLFGLGLAMAVLIDASLVRATLVPAFMKLAGEANWWAPAWMRRIHDRFGLSEAPPDSAFDLDHLEIPDDPSALHADEPVPTG